MPSLSEAQGPNTRPSPYYAPDPCVRLRANALLEDRILCMYSRVVTRRLGTRGVDATDPTFAIYPRGDSRSVGPDSDAGA
jgi:hypothetical protein